MRKRQARTLRGQAAIEYLTTYGWALLALVIVFVALVASGALNLNYLVSEQCTFGTDFQCHDAVFNAASGTATSMNVQLFNGFPYKVRVDGVSLRTEDGTRTVAWTNFATGIEMESGTNTTLLGIVSRSKFPVGTIARFIGNITYVSCAPELGGCTDSNHTVTGKIIAKVQ